MGWLVSLSGRAPLNHSPARQWRVFSRIWRVKIASLLASVASDNITNFYMKYKQSMWIEHSHAAYQWKANQIFNLERSVAFCFVAIMIFHTKLNLNLLSVSKNF